ncbi:MAG TPA: chloride channel protein [Candidatus Binataceae bacterium]|nr:chloride channel protein [Candidatus Binataceae bacterium]
MRRLWPLALRTDEFDYTLQILLAAAVGVLAALGNLGFRALIGFFSWLFRDLEWNALGIERGGIRLGLVPLVLLSGGIGMILLDRLFPGDVLGYGFPNFLEMVNLGSARIKRSWIVLKGLGAALSLGCGASVGREGPIAQIGGAIGSTIAQLRRLPANRARVLVAAGAGAGIATTFNAPVGGVLFAQEIVLLGQTELSNLTLLLVATVSAVVFSRAALGNEAVFQPPTFVLRTYWELLSYGLMGLLLGALSAGYIHLFHAMARAFRKWNVAQWMRVLVGLAIVGLVAIPLPQNLSDGYPVINRAMAGHFDIKTTLALTAAKLFASSVSLGSGAPGGVFGPTFFIGTMAGASFQRALAALVPKITGPRGSYALVGLGTFLCGVTHAPLTALFLLLDMTQDYQIALPAMIAAVAALVVARSLEPESIDTYRLAREGKTLEIGRERLVLTQLPVEGAMTREPASVRASTPLAEVLRVAGETAQLTLPVVSDAGVLVGIIVTHDLVAMFGSQADVAELVNAYDICRRNCPMVLSDSNLDEAAQLMESEDLDELPVVEPPPTGEHGYRLVGIVARKDISAVLNRMALSLSSLAATGTSIFWATGYRLTRITVPPTAQGKTMIELAPRSRFGVSVLAVQNAGASEDGFVPITPDYRLAAGDTLMAAGRPGDLRRFVRGLEEP